MIHRDGNVEQAFENEWVSIRREDKMDMKVKCLQAINEVEKENEHLGKEQKERTEVWHRTVEFLVLSGGGERTKNLNSA